MLKLLRFLRIYPTCELRVREFSRRCADIQYRGIARTTARYQGGGIGHPVKLGRYVYLLVQVEHTWTGGLTYIARLNGTARFTHNYSVALAIVA